MPDTIAGVATIFGINGTVTYSGVTATIEPEQADYEDQFDVAELTDKDGDIIAFAAHKPREEANFTLYITGANLAAAEGLVKPGPLAEVTTANFQVAHYNGTWNYIGGWKIMGKKDDFWKVQMPCRRAGGAALTAPA